MSARSGWSFLAYVMFVTDEIFLKISLKQLMFSQEPSAYIHVLYVWLGDLLFFSNEIKPYQLPYKQLSIFQERRKNLRLTTYFLLLVKTKLTLNEALITTQSNKKVLNEYFHRSEQ